MGLLYNDEYSMTNTKTCVLILDNIRSVENTASIFRTGDGFGVSKIYLIGTTPAPIDRFGRKRSDFAKVALGAEEAVDWEHARSAVEVIKELKSQGFTVISLEQAPESKELNSYEAEKLESLALIVGNEVEGVSQEALDLSDEILEIKMRGKKESLNVSVSTGIALYALTND
jgi:tRNA G18 (ribose-2'-O)-methylase SpoU